MIKYLRVIRLYMITTWQTQSAYRLAAVMWIINGSIIPLMMMGIWLNIRQANDLPMTNSEVITYYLFSIVVVRLTQSWIAERLGNQIHDGDLSGFLVRPIGYWIAGFSIDMGLKMLRMVTLIPFIVIFGLLFSDQIKLDLSFTSLNAFIIAITIGFLLNFVMQNVIGLTAFWLEHAYGATTMYQAVSWLFNGSLIPAPFMPPLILNIALFTPLWYLVGFPISILMGSVAGDQILKGFQISLIWLVLLLTLWWWVYQRGVKSFTAVGI
jgi:ABC-2 type transport system permease protein